MHAWQALNNNVYTNSCLVNFLFGNYRSTAIYSFYLKERLNHHNLLFHTSLGRDVDLQGEGFAFSMQKTYRYLILYAIAHILI